MGLFGGKKTYVASTVYNMAGPEIDRIDYLKSTVGSNVISNTKFTMADTIKECYLKGPGISTRSFHRWANREGNYSMVGIPTMTINSPSYSVPLIESEIPHDSGETVEVSSVHYGPGEYSYWAEQWVLENHQSDFNTNWVADYDFSTNTITITWVDGTTDQFNPIDMSSGENYYFVTYSLKNSTNFLGSYMWIYKVGSGNVIMDDMPVEQPLLGQFLPYIPIRIKNEFLSPTWHADHYETIKKAYKKATRGSKIDKLIEKIADNEDLEDIDFCYMVYGVSLNCLDNSARKYLFKFFDFLRTAEIVGEAEFQGWSGNLTTYQTVYHTQRLAIDDFRESGGTGGSSSDPMFTQETPTAPPIPVNRIRIRTFGTLETNFHMMIEWNAITKTSGTGLKEPGRKKGEVWWGGTTVIDSDEGALYFTDGVAEYLKENKQIELNWQKSDDEWETLTIKGLLHKNLIYDSKSVDIAAWDALEDTEESGFIVPIHYETLRSMSLIDSTQMMTAGTYLVFNSYKVVKQKWYQTGIFKIFVFIVIIVITTATMGAGGGLLGAAASIGAALGFSGFMAVLIGAIANAIAGMILMQILTVAGTAVFGEKLGMLIATIASVIAMSVGSSLMAGQSLATAWGNMMNAQNIISLTSSVGEGISGYINASTMEIQGRTQDLVEDYEKRSAELKQQYLEEFGYGRFVFDPNLLTNNNPYGLVEMAETFLDRTLMTGMDIAEMTNGMLSDFASLTLDTSTIDS